LGLRDRIFLAAIHDLCFGWPCSEVLKSDLEEDYEWGSNRPGFGEKIFFMMFKAC
jgi:hypothetical protein